MHLRDHSQKLLEKVKNSKTKKQKLKQEKESSEKKPHKSLSDKEEENLRSKTLYQRLIEQIKDLKEQCKRW